MEPDPSPAQVPFSSPDRGPVRVPSPAVSVDASDDEEGYQRMLTSGTIASINVGPIGLASSFAALGPVLARRPIAVLIQEAHVPAGQLQSLRALQLAEADAKGTGTRAALADAIKVGPGAG